MPNYSKIEQDVLGPKQLELADQSRHPALAELDDAGIYDLLDRLRAERDAAETSASAGDPGPAEMMRAAIRRVEAERRKRGLRASRGAAKPTQPSAPATTKPTEKPTAKPVAKPKVSVAVSTRRKAASARKPAGRKPAEARKTDLRTEPHRIRKPHAAKAISAAAPPQTIVDAPDNDHLHVTRDSTMTSKDAEKAAKQAARKAEKEAAKVAEKAAAKAERLATKEAEKEARRAARKAEKDAEKEAAKAERRAARKAEKQAESKGTGAKPKAKAKAKDAGEKPGKSAGKAKPAGAKPGKAGKAAKE
ncbi:MAG: hypothetical protein ACK4GC_07810 [Paracoccaceae bacterium]